MSTTKKSKKSLGKVLADNASAATEKARKAASAEIEQRLAKLDAAEASGEHAAFAHDGRKVKVSIPADPPRAEAAAVAALVPATPEVPATGQRGAKGAKAASDNGDATPAGNPPAKSERGSVKPAKPRKTSALDAAAIVIAKADQPMSAAALVEAMLTEKLWKSPGGKTPEATLYAAIIREIAAKGTDARFRKVERGLFTAGSGIQA